MTEARKWTPGPWVTVYGPRGFENHAPENISIRRKGNQNGIPIAQIIGTNNDQRDADGALIAAAPDLYEAGKAICAALEASWNETDEIPGFAELKAALAKAEGRE